MDTIPKSYAHDEPVDALLGESIGERYRVVERIGRGGMGTVYRVQQLSTGREFALKVLHRHLWATPFGARRFVNEVTALSRVRSEHVVDIVDAGELPDHSGYFVMELLQGENLRWLLAREPSLPPSRVARLGVDICLGLAKAHAAGLIHRDLKPENVFLTRGDDGREIAKLLDFGLAKLLDTSQSRSAPVVGTARYMAPEQIEAGRELGPAADVFSAGAILYECLAGRPAFSGESMEQIFFEIFHCAPRPLTQLCQSIPNSLAELIHGSLAKDPKRRPSSATEFGRRLAAFATPNAGALRACAPVTAGEATGPASLSTALTSNEHRRAARRIGMGSRFVGVLALALGLVGLGASLSNPFRALSSAPRGRFDSVAVPSSLAPAASDATTHESVVSVAPPTGTGVGANANADPPKNALGPRSEPVPVPTQDSASAGKPAAKKTPQQRAALAPGVPKSAQPWNMPVRGLSDPSEDALLDDRSPLSR
jgi:serine/threonine-protein kinase